MHNAKHMLSILSPRPLQGHRAVGDGDDQHVQGSAEEHKLCETPHSPITGRVRIFNLGCRFFASKVVSDTKFLAVCEQIKQNFLGTYDLRSS